MAFNYWPNVFLLRQFLSQRMPWFSSLPVQILPGLQMRLKDDFPDFSHWDEVSSTLESLYSWISLTVPRTVLCMGTVNDRFFWLKERMNSTKSLRTDCLASVWPKELRGGQFTHSERGGHHHHLSSQSLWFDWLLLPGGGVFIFWFANFNLQQLRETSASQRLDDQGVDLTDGAQASVHMCSPETAGMGTLCVVGPGQEA